MTEVPGPGKNVIVVIRDEKEDRVGLSVQWA